MSYVRPNAIQTHVWMAFFFWQMTKEVFVMNVSQQTLELIKLIGICHGAQTEEMPASLDMFALARSRSHKSGTIFLASGGKVDSALYHVLAFHPWFVFQAKNDTWCIRRGPDEVSGSGSPLPILRNVLQLNSLPEQPGNGPTRAGLFGYLGYELNQHIESLPCTRLDDSGLPDMYLSAPSIILVQEVNTGSTWLHLPKWEHEMAPSVLERYTLFEQWMQEAKASVQDQRPAVAGPPRSSLTHDQYVRSVQAILGYIRSGDVYQVNLSQRLEHTFVGCPFGLFETLYARNPAPFYAYVQAGDHQVISTSPERFLSVQGRRVETRPIKGTRPRGKSPEQDQALAHELLDSEKDSAELSMIVDLMRNDLGRVCTPGSVQVTEHKRLEAYDNVYHLVSVVQGLLEPEYDLVDMIQAAFPGGSITGCPKIRSMEIIDELEPFERHVYTGSIGYLGFDRSMDLSIAIRTAVAHQERLIYSVGGGVVIDSDPDDEYQETWHKGRTFAQVLSTASRVKHKPVWIWLNGHLVMDEEAQCALRSPAVEYGFGVFETLLADNAEPWFCPDHIARMGQAWKNLSGHDLPRLDWGIIISQVLEANSLQHTAAVKIYAGVGPDRNIFCVSARPYTNRLAGQKRSHLNLLTHPEPRQNFLAGMKTANHLLYILAGKWAREYGADEALITNPDGSISETNSANLVLLFGSRAIIPESVHVLPGIMQAKALEALSKTGFACTRRQLYPEDLFRADAVLVTNSLLGVVAAGSLDGKGINRPESVVHELNQRIFIGPRDQ